MQNLLLLQTIIRGFIYRFSFQVIMFIITLMIAELMGVHLFGSLSLMIVNAAAFMLLTGLGTDAAIVWHASGNKLTSSKTFTFAILFGAIQFLVYIIAQFICYIYFDHTLLAHGLKGFLFYETVYIAGLILMEKYTSLLYGHQIANIANKVISVVALVFLLVVLLVFSKLLSLKPEFIFTSMIFLLGTALAITFHSRIKVRLERLIRADRDSLFAFSGVVFITNLVQFMAYRLDFWLIDHYHGSDELGIYAQASRFAQLLWIIPGIFAALVIPSIRKEQDGLTEPDFQRLTRVLAVASVFVGILVILFAWLIYRFFLSGDFSPGWKPLLIMLPGYVLFAVSTILAAWFSAKRMLSINLTGSTICFLLIAVLDIALIPSFALKGAAVANLVAYSLTTLYFIYQYLNRSEKRLKDMFLFRIKDISGLKKLFADGR